MSAGNARAMPGSTQPRNGLPPSGGYVYRGLGYDQLDPRRSLGAQRRSAAMQQKVAEGFKPYGGTAPDGRCADCGYLLTAPGHKLVCGGAP